MARVGASLIKTVTLLKPAVRQAERVGSSNFHLCSRLSARPDLRNQGYGPKKWTYDLGKEADGTRVKANQDCVMHKNKAIAKPEPERHRSEYPNWNFEAELYAFGRRLGEEFDEPTLRKALCDPTYARQQMERERGVGLGDEVSTEANDNSKLRQLGRGIIDNYVKAYLRTHFPNLPEEGCDQICGYLTSELVSAHIALNIGLADLVLTDRVKPLKSMLSNCLHAVVGALALSSDEQRAQSFVLDMIVTQLSEQDLFELIDAELTTFDLLEKVFKSHLNASLEPRIIRSTGSDTILSAFTVGIFSDKDPDGGSAKTFVGSGFGETVDIAIDMAAKDSLRSFFGLHPGVRLSFGRDARRLSIQFDTKNWSISMLS